MMKKTPRPQAMIQVDLDSLWAIQRVYGAKSKPPQSGDPLLLEALERYLTILPGPSTFFVIGADCNAPAAAKLLKETHAAGHEIANHSATHPIGMAHLTEIQLQKEIHEANQAIAKITGTPPVGFRAPGYALSQRLLCQLEQAGMRYDSSLLPTRIAPVLRFAARMLKQNKGHEAAPEHYGAGQPWKAPRNPHHPLPESALLEIPVSVTPRLRLPVHASLGMLAGWKWTRHSLQRIHATGGPLVYLLHAIDLVDPATISGLPSGCIGSRIFGRSLTKRQDFLRRVLDWIETRYDLIRTDTFSL